MQRRSTTLLRQRLLEKSHTKSVTCRCQGSRRQWQHASTTQARTFATSRVPLSSSTTPLRESIIPQTHYDLFPETLGQDAIPPKASFHLDLQKLRREFLQLQQKAHPDVAPANRKREAEALSARINEAYRTLQDPLRRAQYLLSLGNIDVISDEAARSEDQGLLMDVLEANETIEEAESEGDLDEIRSINGDRIKESHERIAEAFAQDDVELAKSETMKLRYWMNIQNSIDDWERGKPVVLIH